MSTSEITISALMLAMIAAAASARAESIDPAAPEALAAFDYAKDKARANYKSARDRCAEVEGTQERCETRARADYQARLVSARARYEGSTASQARGE